SLADHEQPEILAADLTDLVMDLANWGVTDPGTLAFIDPPPAGALEEARTLLKEIDALDAGGQITRVGRALSKLPVHPRLAHMIIAAEKLGLAQLAAEIALLLGERGLGGQSTDLRSRVISFRNDRGERAKKARKLARQWIKNANLSPGDADDQSVEQAGKILALAYPDRIAQARGAAGTYRLANGRGAQLDSDSPLFGTPFLAAAEIQGSAVSGRILLAAPIAQDEIEETFSDHIGEEEEFSITASGVVTAQSVRRLSRLVLSTSVIANPSGEKVVSALLRHIAQKGLGLLPMSRQTRQWRQRIDYLHQTLGTPWPDLSDTKLLATLPDWLGPYLIEKRSLADIRSGDLHAALEAQLPYELSNALGTLAPSHFETPTGSRIAIDYGAEAGPTISVRVQELFGLTTHPSVAKGRLPLVLELLSPAQRPIQVTKDLPRFWAGSWTDVKADMRGRYPKHPWPDDPASAVPTRRANPRRR
ncbi:MAG: ATP-dependent helicase C-terminal domain-containing protein, partial [Stappiaceae bacterium]